MKRLHLLHLIFYFIIVVGLFFGGAMLRPAQAVAAWAPNVAYAIGNQVTYQDGTHPNHLYQCIQAHTSEVGWEPPNVPALWSDLGPYGSATATPTKSNTPAPTKTNTPSGGATATKTNTPASTNTATFVPPTATKTATSSGGTFPVSQNQFNNWFPNRNGLYTYTNFTTAQGAYSGFASSGNTTNDTIEAAAFFAHVAHETSYLVYTDEQNYTPGYYCASWDTHYLCASGQDYHGRGPLQLSWNYNYKMASNGQYFSNGTTWVTIMTPTVGADIWSNAGLVSTDGVITWKTALWFWMNHGKDWDPAKTTPHQDIVNTGFGQTTMDINGGIECGQASGTLGYNEMQDRASIYTTFLSNLNVSDNRTKTC